MAKFYKNTGSIDIELPSGRLFCPNYHYKKDCPAAHGIKLSDEDQTFLDDLVEEGKIELIEIDDGMGA